MTEDFNRYFTQNNNMGPSSIDEDKQTNQLTNSDGNNKFMINVCNTAHIYYCYII